MNEILRTILSEWKLKPLPESVPRGLDLKQYLRVGPGKIIVVSGFRRVGKTYLLYGLIKELLREKARESVVYVNFEDERIPMKTDFLSAMVPGLTQFFGREPELLFLDEVQNVPLWSKWLRRINDSGRITLFVSGSSSKMSGKEIPTELRGRFIEVKVLPLSFREFLSFKRLEFDMAGIQYSPDQKARLLHALGEYVERGGLPEVVLAEEARKSEIVNSYYQTVVRRDIIERNKVRNEEALKALLRLLLNSTHYTISKLHDTIKSLGHRVGKTTLQNYLSYIENSYFAFSVSIFSYKVKDQLLYPRKVYFIDNSFIRLFSSKFSENHGRLYENLVAVELKRRQRTEEEFYYWKSHDSEVDFAVERGGKIGQLIQVCYDVSEVSTKERETRALVKASKELKCDNLLVITEDYEKEELVSWFGETVKVRFLPLWKWLLEE